jgi:hypothetical protein
VRTHPHKSRQRIDERQGIDTSIRPRDTNTKSHRVGLTMVEAPGGSWRGSTLRPRGRQKKRTKRGPPETLADRPHKPSHPSPHLPQLRGDPHEFYSCTAANCEFRQKSCAQRGVTMAKPQAARYRKPYATTLIQNYSGYDHPTEKRQRGAPKIVGFKKLEMQKLQKKCCEPKLSTLFRPVGAPMHRPHHDRQHKQRKRAWRSGRRD